MSAPLPDEVTPFAPSDMLVLNVLRLRLCAPFNASHMDKWLARWVAAARWIEPPKDVIA